jgi:putative transposase
VLDNNHLLAAARYVERNPVRANCAKDPWDWKWSSAAHHIGKSNSRLPLADIFGLISMNPKKWKDYIATEDAVFVKEIRQQTQTGRPFGNNAFIEDLECRLSRKLTALPVGRPKIGRCP